MVTHNGSTSIVSDTTNMDTDGSPPPATPVTRALVLSPPKAAREDAKPRVRVSREEQRERERLSRIRRVEKTTRMRFHVAQLERVALALKLLPDADGIWDEYVDADIKALRGVLRKLLPVMDEAKRLALDNWQLRQLMGEHKYTSMMLTQILARESANSDWEERRKAWGQMTREEDLHVQLMERLQRGEQREATVPITTTTRSAMLDDWLCQCELWRTITEDCYKPFSSAQCNKLVDETLATIKAYKMPKDVGGDTPAVFGWRDARGLDGTRRSVHFNTLKTYRRSDMDATVAMCWLMYQEGDRFKQFVLGEGVQLYYKVLQHVSDNIVIIQNVEKYPGLDMTVHSLFMTFRMKTENGHLIGLRCIQSPELQRAMRDEGLSEADTFYWSQWDVSERDKDTGEILEYTTSVNGVISGTDPAYAERWVIEGILAIIRIESKLYGTPPLVFGVPTEPTTSPCTSEAHGGEESDDSHFGWTSLNSTLHR